MIGIRPAKEAEFQFILVRYQIKVTYASQRPFETAAFGWSESQRFMDHNTARCLLQDLVPADGLHSIPVHKQSTEEPSIGWVQPRRIAVAGKARLKSRQLRRQNRVVKAARGGVGCNPLCCGPYFDYGVFLPTKGK
ncbi:MAG: hypothetical protein JXA14_25870 [Anaerolineae bacterium]|nr:hypothetical protein [Anaerolineae bacterium]